MQKSTKLLLGAATLWPFVYMFLFFILVFSMLFLGPGAERVMPFVFVLHMLTILLVLGLTVFYIVDIFKNERVEKDKKVLWAMVIFFGNMVAMPVYWYLYVWKEAAVAGPPLPGQLNSANSSAWTNDVNASRPREEQYTPPTQPPDWR